MKENISIKKLREEGIKEQVKRIPPKWFVDGDKGKNYYLCQNAVKHITEETAHNALVAMRDWNGLENLKDIKSNFGNEISYLVDGVTKLSKLEGRTDKFKQAENFRKLLLATSKDIRVLLVKLADRLHNMRTIHYIKDSTKKKKIAHETLEIFAPLAERLGMQEIRAELDDLSFKIIEPELRSSIIQRLKVLRLQDEELLEKTINKIHELLKNNTVEAKIFGREKKPYSIWKKMKIRSVNFS